MRLARAAALSIQRHRGASAVAIATLAFMLSALTIFILLANGLGQAASGLESKADLVAYLNSNAGSSSVSKLKGELHHRWPQASVTYVSPSQALRQFRQTSIGKSITGAIEGNPLPASLDIKTPNPLTLSAISTTLNHDRSVHNVILNRNLTNKLVQITTVVSIGGIALVLGLAFLALVMVVNTTHLSIEARKEEIEVVRLVGATQAFVRNPLIVEGVMLGTGGALVASVVGLGVFLPVLKWATAGSSALGELLPISSSPMFFLPLTLSILIIGAGIGALGSYVSVRRFAEI